MANGQSNWTAALNDEDGQFLKRFLLASGSLKALAKEYGISYPTVRARLDRLIAKVRAADATVAADPLERSVRLLVADGALSPTVGRELLRAHAQSLDLLKGETDDAS
ncbi:MAG: DUF2089 domain-containing protein [bacterium]|nr:DUF2089 domain-containing protein [bacterium]